MLADMPTYGSPDGLKLFYLDEGTGAPVVLVHGFVSHGYVNWVRPGTVRKLVDAGRRVIVPDARGHGSSSAPHDPASYGADRLVEDVIGLLNHLDLENVDMAGYSMGAATALCVASSDNRIRKLVASGVGESVMLPVTDAGGIAEALEVDDPATLTDRYARSFRDFADLIGADRLALAALQRAGRPRLEASRVPHVKAEVLVLIGDRDPIAEPAQPLVDALPNATLKVVEGTHLNVINNPRFQRALIDFLD